MTRTPTATSPAEERRPHGQAISQDLTKALSDFLHGDDDNQQVFAHVAYQGPIPPPDQLREFEKIQPGLANRIVRLAEREQEHRHKQEERELALLEARARWEARRLKIGQFAGIGITLLLIGTAIYFATRGDRIAAGLFLAAPLLEAIQALIQPRARTNRSAGNENHEERP